MSKYHLRSETEQDIDLTRYVRTPRGEAYFHKPIGSPIGGGGRGAQSVTAKAAPWNVGGQKFNQFGEAEKAALKLFDGVGQQTAAPHRPHLASAPKAESKSGFVQGKEMAQLVDRNKAYKAKQRAERAAPPEAPALQKTSQADEVFQHAIDQATEPFTPAQREQITQWWAGVKGSSEVKDGLNKDLGIAKEFQHKDGTPLSPKELKKKATDKHSTPEERAKFQKEYVRRIAQVNEAVRAKSALAARLEKKPEDADLAPIVGETLLAHPGLGPLAHVYDRMRVHAHNFTHGLPWADVVRDKSGDVVSRVGSVLLAIFLLHLGVYVPGLGG